MNKTWGFRLAAVLGTVAIVSAPQLKGVAAAQSAAVPTFAHVVVVIMENTSNASIIGNTGQAAYINSLASQYSYSSNNFAPEPAQLSRPDRREHLRHHQRLLALGVPRQGDQRDGPDRRRGPVVEGIHGGHARELHHVRRLSLHGLAQSVRLLRQRAQQHRPLPVSPRSVHAARDRLAKCVEHSECFLDRPRHVQRHARLFDCHGRHVAQPTAPCHPELAGLHDTEFAPAADLG